MRKNKFLKNHTNKRKSPHGRVYTLDAYDRKPILELSINAVLDELVYVLFVFIPLNSVD